MKESKFIDKEFSSESLTESISLDDVKEQLYIDASNTDFDDTLNNLIPRVRQYVEEITALSLIERTVTFYVDYQAPFRIPFGPVTSFVSASVKTGINEWEVKTENDDYEIVAGKFTSYIGNGLWKLIYEAGYTESTLLEGIRLALLNEVARRFTNRGDNTIVGSTNELIEPYKMLEWLM